MRPEPTENSVRVILCEDWSVFVREVKKTRFISTDGRTRKVADAVLFRGHAREEWRLSSTLERSLQVECTPHHLRKLNGTKWYKEQCNKILERFTANATGLPGFREDASELSRWMQGRHFGLLSPYLDWSTSPFVAVFFALEEVYSRFSGLRASYPTEVPCSVHVWGLRLWRDITEPDVFEIHMLTTAHGTRQRAQRAAFNWLNSADHIDLESYLTSRGLAYYLERYDLILANALDALKELELMNVTYSSLFPDIEGAARDANMITDFLHMYDLFESFLRQKRSEKDTPSSS